MERDKITSRPPKIKDKCMQIKHNMKTYTLRVIPLCYLTKMAMLCMWDILAKTNQIQDHRPSMMLSMLPFKMILVPQR